MQIDIQSSRGILILGCNELQLQWWSRDDCISPSTNTQRKPFFPQCDFPQIWSNFGLSTSYVIGPTTVQKFYRCGRKIRIVFLAFFYNLSPKQCFSSLPQFNCESVMPFSRCGITPEPTANIDSPVSGILKWWEYLGITELLSKQFTKDIMYRN